MTDLSRYVITAKQATALSVAFKQFSVVVGGVSDDIIHSIAAFTQRLNLEREQQGPTIGRKRRKRRARGRLRDV